VMLAQPSVKRALAYSTIAQMGFMLLQCGLGAFGLALLHIAAHSLYKAHAFLTAGSTIGATTRAAIPLRTPALALGVLAGGLIVSALATLLTALFPSTGGQSGLFTLILALALAYGFARLASTGAGIRSLLRSAALAAGLTGAALALHSGASALFASSPAPTAPLALTAFISTIFVALFLFQALLWRAGEYELGRRLYVHALNGFYVGTYANRFLGRLWPNQVTG
jgi:NAD(P)H-quinone oxidoreductase subunit 5